MIAETAYPGETRWLPADAEQERCYNCGAWGGATGRDEYRCPNCGDEWDVYAEHPEYREDDVFAFYGR